MALTAELLGDRWTLLILREAFYGVQRYDDMRKDLNAPRSMLTDRLNKLVESGIMIRRAYREEGDRERNAYALSEKGAELALVLMAMTQWGEKHILGKEAATIVVDKRTGQRLEVTVVDENGEITDIANAHLRKR